MFLLDKGLHWIAKGKLSIFLFHKVPALADALQPGDMDQQTFRRTVAFIRKHFHVYPLAEAARLLTEGRLPDRCAAITFDDGYQDWRQGAASILQELNVPATFFITTGQFDGRPMWHERLAHVVNECGEGELDTRFCRLPPLPTATLADKVKAVKALEFHFKYIPPVLRDIYLAQLEDTVGASAADVTRMPVDDVVRIAQMGFEIGAHTHDHPILSMCDAQRAAREIGEAKERLECILGSSVIGFAYPNGRPSVDFTTCHIDMVKSAGYRYAVTTQWGAVRQDTSPFQMPRFTPWGPSHQHMALQVFRNIFKEADSLPEARGLT